MTSLITDDGKVNFSEIEIYPRTADGKFYTQLSNNTSRVREIPQDHFLNLLVATANSYYSAKTAGCGEDLVKLRYDRYKFYENQIDIAKGDMFTALLYDFNCWIFL